MISLFQKQLFGMAGGLPAMLIAVLAIAYAPQFLTDLAPRDHDVASRLAYVAKWLLLPGLCLFAGIFGASRRGFYADAIEGTRTPENNSLEINLRYNQNTIEQLLLAAIGWLGLCLILPGEQLVLIPAMAIIFAVGRVTFWIGYAIHPMARAFGMTLTVIPTIFAYGMLIADAV